MGHNESGDMSKQFTFATPETLVAADTAVLG